MKDKDWKQLFQLCPKVAESTSYTYTMKWKLIVNPGICVFPFYSVYAVLPKPTGGLFKSRVLEVASIQFVSWSLIWLGSTPQDDELGFGLKRQEEELESLRFKEIPLCHTRVRMFHIYQMFNARVQAKHSGKSRFLPSCSSLIVGGKKPIV